MCDAWHGYQVVREICTINDADTVPRSSLASPPIYSIKPAPRTAASGGRSRSGSHRSQHGTAPTSRAVRLTKAINNLVKRVKFTAFGTNFRNYRIRSLLHAGKPDGALLAITPR